MYRYAREFPTKIIPHCTENGEINDIIHNYKRPKISKEAPHKRAVKRSPRKGEAKGEGSSR